jgi:hypothetical protein
VLDIGVANRLGVSVAGKPVNLFIDLGGFSPISLSTGALSNVPVNFLGSSVRYQDISGTIHVSREFTANNVKLGGTDFGNLRGVEFFHSTEALARQSGYIGFGLLEKFLLVFDYPGKTLGIYQSGNVAAMVDKCGPKRFDIQVVNGVTQSTIQTDKGPLLFQWDSGSSENILRPSALGIAPGASMQSFGKFELAGTDFRRTVFPLREFRAPNVDGVLGTDFLESKVFCIDLRSKTAAIR